MTGFSSRRLRLAAVTVLLAASACSRASAEPVVTMYMTPTCGCCKHWGDHMRENGFTVREVRRSDLASIRAEHGVPGRALSCHTSVVDGYAVEGHVPADAVRRLLRERPAVRGIAVPGMPIGSPGMEQLGARWQDYDVVTFDAAGTMTVFETRTGGDH
jgi:hypothetical protein